MILLFGGTTEGRKAIKELEEAGKPYFYSTKTGEQDVVLQHGQRTDGAMDTEAMVLFCKQHGIRLLIDAAHPFAAQLHQTVATAAALLRLPAIRYERIFPPRSDDITWCDNYEQIPSDMHVLLATTGVQSIAKLKHLEEKGVTVYYRILPRESSLQLARKQGAHEERLCYYHEGEDECELLESLHADALLLKESGITGGFVEKTAAARQKGVRIIALKRPPTPAIFHKVNGEHGLRRMVEKLLPDYYDLHSGLTTGTCATAAAKAAYIAMKTHKRPTQVDVTLPNGETIAVDVHYGEGYAYVVKDSGDDPDVTNGLQIRADVSESDQFEICGGEGIGTITVAGFDYSPGSPAINKVPRQMLRQNINDAVRITISVPGGAAVASRTFNPRLGIEGGISIVGVSGIIKPFSEEAFVDSIRKCMQVAKASGSRHVVINSGAKSENILRSLFADLPPQAFVQYGNYIGDTIKMAAELEIEHVTLGVMLGKAVKLASGQLDTHSRKGVMDKTFISQLLREADCDTDCIRQLTLARELWDMIPREKKSVFAQVVISHCQAHCKSLLPHGELTILLIDEKGEIYR